MSRALAVYHGRFGRAVLYELRKPMTMHAHREGHLLFYVGGCPGIVRFREHAAPIAPGSAVAVNSWEPHCYIPGDPRQAGYFLVFYIDPTWFNLLQLHPSALQFGRPVIEMTRSISVSAREVLRRLENCETPDNFDGLLFELTDLCADQSWLANRRGRSQASTASAFLDFRVRKSIRLLTDLLGGDIELDEVARESGLSRPHFYKLFRSQTGLTPNLFLNTLRIERAVSWLGDSGRSVTDIAYDLGFSCQSVFTRFFSAHVGVAPTDYRRAVQVLHG